MKELVAVAVWTGMLAGIAEAAMLGLASTLLDRYTHQGPHLAWMAPAAYTVLFLALLAPVALLTLRRPGARLRLLTLLWSALAAIGVLLNIPQLALWASLLLSLGFGIQASALATRHRDAFLRLVRRTTLPLAALVALAWLAWLAAPPVLERRRLAGLPAAPDSAPNVLLLILDTVRAMDLSVYGYARATTPRLERLAAAGTTFDFAVAPAPWTLPTHAALLTGRATDSLNTDWKAGLADGVPTLAEALAARGWRTAGFVANTHYLSGESGIRRGFARWEDFVFSPGQVLMSSSIGRRFAYSEPLRKLLGNYDTPGRKTAARINRDFLRWLGAPGEGSAPWFALLNYYDAHEPYLPPPPFDAAFGPLDPHRGVMLSPAKPLTPDQLAQQRLAYDGAIAWLDDAVGRLLDSLAARGGRPTLIVVTSDHGEEFGEHRWLTHGFTLYVPSLRVPLLLALEGRVAAGARVTAPVSLRDVPATVLALAGVRDATFPGASLLRFAADSTAADTAYSEVRRVSGHPAFLPASKGRMRSLVADRWHYIVGGDGAEELYDLRADSLEARNLAGEPAAAPVMAQLRAAMRARQ